MLSRELDAANLSLPQLEAPRAWLRTVFDKEPDLDDQDLDVFANFYWLLYQEKPRDARDLLCKHSKARGLPATCSMAAIVRTEPLATRPRAANIPEARDLGKGKPTANASRRQRGRPSKRSKRDVADGSEPDDIPNISRTRPHPPLHRSKCDGIASAPPVSPADGMEDGVSALNHPSNPTGSFSVSAPIPRPLSAANTTLANGAGKMPGRKRKAKKLPSSGNASTDKHDTAFTSSTVVEPADGGFNTDSTLTSLSSESEGEALLPTGHALNASEQLPSSAKDNVPACQPIISALSLATRGLRDVSTRKAANPERLQLWVNDMNAHERGRRKGKSGEVPLNSHRSVSAAGPATRTRPKTIYNKKKSLGLSAVAARLASAKAATQATRRTVAVRPSTSDSRSAKKRKTNAGNPAPITQSAKDDDVPLKLLQKAVHVPKAASKHHRQSRQRVADKAVEFKAQENAATGSAPTAQDTSLVRERKGRKRAREEIASPQFVAAQGPETHRLTIRLPRRSQARLSLKSAAPHNLSKPKFSEIDHLVCDAGTNALLVLHPSEEQASEWEQDADAPQPGDSTDDDDDDDEPLRRKGKSKKTKLRQVGGKPTQKASSVASQQRQERSVHKTRQGSPTCQDVAVDLEDGELREEEAILQENDSLDELTYPHLTPCPLLDDSSDIPGPAKQPLPTFPPIWAEVRSSNLLHGGFWLTYAK